MPRRKPTIFVGSSSEAANLAERFSTSLDRDLAASVHWASAPEFISTRSTLDSLFEAARSYDYGFFIFTPDDRYQSRGHEGSIGRDNVLFEFGLFLGALGPDRVFAVVQEAENEVDKLKIPTDLWGIQIDRFKKANNERTLASSVDRATFRVRERIRQVGPKPLNLHPVSRWGYETDLKTFSIVLARDPLDRFKSLLEGGGLCVVVRKRNDELNNDADRAIVVSEIRELPRIFVSDLLFRINVEKLQPNDDDILEAYVWLVPSGTQNGPITTMRDMFDSGWELVEHVARKVT